MAKNNDKPSSQMSSEMKEIGLLDKAAKNLMSVLDPGFTNKQILKSKDQKIRSILNRELDLTKGASNGSIVDFVSSLQTNDLKQRSYGQNNSPDTNEMFTKNINEVFEYFQDVYRNKYLEMQDLKFIAKFIPALGEAVKTTLDSITGADDISETFNRIIDLPPSITIEDRAAIENEIKRFEKELHLLKKLRNIVYKKTLVTGTHYVYAKAYEDLFNEYDKIKKKEEGKNLDWKASMSSKPTNESYVLGDVDISAAMESVSGLLQTSKDMNGKMLTKNTISGNIAAAMDELPIITCESSTIYSVALEDFATMENSEFVMEAFKKKAKKSNDENEDAIDLRTPDGAHDIKSNRKKSKFDVSGTYVKYIDAKELIPIDVFEERIGYFIVHPKTKNGKPKTTTSSKVSGITSIGSTLFGSADLSEKKKSDAIEKIVDSISDGILTNFSSKFVLKNVEYKKMIADCIVANGLSDKDYNIQFVPAEDIIEFKVNEKEDGTGESMLADSLFPAKLLLDMIVCRMLNYINKTGNKTYAHIKKGPVGVFTTNQMNKVIRDLQESNVTFNDLLSPNLVFNKFNRDGNVALPRAQNGEKLVELETMEGQNIDMRPEYEEKLENMAIVGTGVPSVIMEYANTADFAKQIVSAHIKFAGRVHSYQSDLEESTTMLYRKLCRDSNLSDAQKAICEQSLSIQLPKPTAGSNANNSEFLSTITSNAEAIANLIIGQESVQNQDILKNGPVIKDKLMYSIAKDTAPFIDWTAYETEYKKIAMEYSSKTSEDDNDSTDGGF